MCQGLFTFRESCDHRDRGYHTYFNNCTGLLKCLDADVLIKVLILKRQFVLLA